MRLLRCAEAAMLASRSLDAPLSLGERLALRLHLSVCAMCARYLRQLRLLRRILRSAPLGLGRESLPPALRDRLREALRRARP